MPERGNNEIKSIIFPLKCIVISFWKKAEGGWSRASFVTVRIVPAQPSILEKRATHNFNQYLFQKMKSLDEIQYFIQSDEYTGQEFRILDAKIDTSCR